MTRVITFLILIISLLSYSCSSRDNKVDSSNVIPEKDLISLLTDLYLTDGILNIPRSFNYSLPDSTTEYLDVLKKYGYTKESIDRTMMYYYMKKPKELISIYDQVLGTLSEMESRYGKELTLMERRLSNIWSGSDFYFLPDPSDNDSAIINVPLLMKGTYLLSYTATLSACDQSYNPHPIIFTCHPDSIDTGKRHYIDTWKYVKDSQPHTYSVEINIAENQFRYLMGWFYGSESCPDESGMTLLVENISLSLKP